MKKDQDEINHDFDEPTGSDFELDEQDAESSQLDSGHEYLSTKPKSKRLGSLKDHMNKRTLVLLGVMALVLIFAIYMVNSILSSGTPSSSAPAQQQQTADFQHGMHQVKPMQRPQPVHVAPQHIVQRSVANTSDLTMSKKEFKQLIQGFSGVVDSANSNLSKGMNNLQLNINQLAGIMGKSSQMTQANFTLLTKKIELMSQNLLKVSNNLAKTQSQLKVLVAEKAQNAQKLSLHAVVPGRAWLTDQDGKTISVSIGSQLPYYGQVTKIDSDAGKVYMSSGYVFS